MVQVLFTDMRAPWVLTPLRPKSTGAKASPATWALKRVTVQNLDVVKVDVENNLIALRGAIPGKGGVVFITDSVKA